MPGQRRTSDQDLERVLRGARTIAVVGLSPRPDRDSHRVARYLQGAGYRIVPVNPGHASLLGEPCFPSLAEVPAEIPLDLADVFRAPESLPDLVRDAVARRVRVLWFQLGVLNPAAEEAALAAGIDLVVDRCILVEHRRLLAG
jgi:hypothetical protein